MAKETSYSEDSSLIGAKEVPFWLQILAEHALLIKSGLSDEQVDDKQEAQAFSAALLKGYHQAEQVTSGKKLTYVLRCALPLMKDFLLFQQNLLAQILCCRQKGWLFPLLVDHMIRENLYALKLFEMFLDQLQCMGKIKRCYVSKPQENLFWVEIAENHAQFVGHLTDPSERNVIDTAQTFQSEFDQLYLQGKDYVSMLRGRTEYPPAFERYFSDVRKATCRFRDFLKLAEELIRQCQLLGVMPASLADHLRRETEYDILLSTMIAKGKICPCVLEKSQDSTEDDCLQESPMESPFESDCESPVSEESPLCEEDYICEEQDDQLIADTKECFTEEPCEPESCEPVICKPDVCEPEPCEELVCPEMMKVPEPKVPESKKVKTSYSAANSNYQWKSHWPRPLGKKGR